MAKCPNINHPDWIVLEKEFGKFNAMKAYMMNNDEIPTIELARNLLNRISQEVKIKPGIPELFESNPELANAVYEALGFKTDKNGLITLVHYSSKNTNPLDNFQEDYPLYTSKGEKSEYEDYGKKYNFLIKETANVKSILDFHGKYGIDLDAHDMRSNGIQPYHFSLQEIQAMRKEGVDILIDDWGEYIILNPNSVVLKEKQKQQAQQLYSAYLDTIFPDSKVKDIVYHGTRTKFDKFDKSFIGKTLLNYGFNGFGFYFDKHKNNAIQFMKVYRDWENKTFVVPAILNMTNPKLNEDFALTGEESNDKQKAINYTEKLQNEGNDSVYTAQHEEYVVFEPEQIHILGSKQDIEGFKNWIKDKRDKSEIYLLPSSKQEDKNKKQKQFTKKLTGIAILDDALIALDENIRNLKGSIYKTNNEVERLEIEEEIKRTEEERNFILEEANEAAFNTVARRQLAYVDEVLNSKTVSATQLKNIADTLYSWKTVANLIKPLAIKGRDKDVKDIYDFLLKDLDAKELKFQDLAMKVIKEFSKRTGINGIEDNLFDSLKDQGWWQTNMYSAAHSSLPLLQMLDLIIRQEVSKTNVLQEEFLKELDIVTKALKTNNEFKEKGFTLFLEKDEKGNPLVTEADNMKFHSLIQEYDMSYWNARNKAIENGTYYKWKRNNEAVVDIWKLIDGGEALAKQEMNFLINEFGKEEADRMIEIAKKKYEKFKEDRELFIYNLTALEENKNLTEEQRKKALDRWEKRNHPKYIAQYLNTKGKPSEELIEISKSFNYEYIYRKPRVKDKSGKDLGYYSKEYQHIQSVPELKAFYDLYISKFLEYRRYIPRQPKGVHKYSIPAMKKDFMQRVFQDGMMGVFGGLHKSFIDSNSVDADQQGIKNITSEQRKKIPIRGVSASDLETDIKDRSLELDNILASFVYMANNFRHKSAVEDAFLLSRKLVDNIGEIEVDERGNTILKPNNEVKTKRAALDNIKKQFDFFINANIYGIRKTDKVVAPKGNPLDTLVGKDKKVDMIKLGDNLLWYTQAKGMGLNILSGTVNLLFGTIGNHIHASGGLDFTTDELGEAIKEMTRNSIKFTKVGQKKTGIHQLLSNVIKRYDILHESRESLYGGDALSIKVGDDYVTIYEVQKRSEFFVQGSVALAMLLNKKVTRKFEDGSTKNINLLDALNVDGTLKDGIELSETELLNYMLKIKEVNGIIHGNYDPNSPIKAKEKWIGRALMQFRSWIPAAYQARFGKTNTLLLGERKGRYLSVLPFLNEYGAGQGITEVFKWLIRNPTAFANLSEQDKANMRSNMTELSYLLGITITGLMLKMVAGKAGDDDEYKYWYLNTLINLGFRLETDLQYFINPLTFDQMQRNLIPCFSVIKDSQQFLEAGVDAMQGDFEYGSGSTIQGQNKLLKEGTDLIPVLNQPYKLYYNMNDLYSKHF